MGGKGSGRKPKPKSELNGSRHAIYERVDEFELPPELPACPDELTGEARKCWNWLIPKLHDSGIINTADEKTLRRYCEMWSDWVAAAKHVRENGTVYTTVDKLGNTIHRRTPQSSLTSLLSMELLKIETNFGMTPASRPSIPAVKKKNDETPFDVFLRGGTNKN